ncbi:MAG: hypothetical protein EP330_02355 [Deltaproteobacteria bacterium]|nr:MAG: hypothetical protein EP330_02355 [Deltaproteobacteria bacterium]
MTHRLALALAPAALLWACNNDVGITGAAVCDGIAQESEETVDAPFDRDGDGFFDAANPGCAATYPADRLDCHDGNADANPEGFELTCNGIDDDCDPATEDSEDEVCDDSVDNDCDSRIDEGCGGNDTGGGTAVFNVTPDVSLSCAYGLVGMSFNSVFVTDDGTTLVIAPTNGGAQPGTMSGISNDPFTVSNSLAGTCTENYTLTGSWDSADQFSGTFSVDFVETSAGWCFDCIDQSWNITATRAP